MPARISPENESKIIELYLQGASQTEIARTMGVSQSTVSQAISRFKKNGNPRSTRVLHEVDQLRSLSVDLRGAGATVDEAKTGCRLIGELGKIGANLDMLGSLLAVYRRISPKDFPVEHFVEATIEMVRLERKYGTGYEALVSSYRQTDAKLIQLNREIEKKSGELTEILGEKKAAEDDLQTRLRENNMTLQELEKALEIRINLEKAGLSLEKGETVGKMLKVFCNLIESKGLSPEKAAAELQGFLAWAQDLDKDRMRLVDEVTKTAENRDSLAAEVEALRSEKKKLAIENTFLKEAVESVLELRQKHGIGVDEIARMRSLAQKYGPPASILQALDTYKSLKDLQEQEARLEGSIQELSQTEASRRGTIAAIERDLAALPAKTDESMKGIKSSLEEYSGEVQALGDTIARASLRVDELKERALAAGKDIADIESRVRGYKLTSKLIDFAAKGTGEEDDVIPVAVAFLDCLTKWVKSQPKYSEITQHIESLKDKIERQMILG